MIIQAPKGTADVLPEQSYRWHYIEERMRAVCRTYGYNEVRLPTFEHTELFLRSVGDTTDIVQKEMYTFEDKGGRSLTLKPEGTAGVARCVIEHSLTNGTLPLKMYYLYSPVFRYERPQAGRYREHHQFGIEVFGSHDASMDAEVIGLALSVLRSVGLQGKLNVKLNSIGCPDCRPVYQKRLKEYFSGCIGEMCETCKGRLDRNPLRILDCKSPVCKDRAAKAPIMLDCLCAPCKEHFQSLQDYLQVMKVTYGIDPMIVRGLDYYTRTVFEIIAEGIGAQSTVCGGGRYDGLLEQMGGPALPGMGFGMGMERLLMTLDAYGVKIEEPPLLDIYIASLGKAAQKRALALVHTMREVGLAADCDHMNRSLKAQFKYADKTKCRVVVMIGDDELACGCAKVRMMEGGTEKTLPLDDLVNLLAKCLGKNG